MSVRAPSEDSSSEALGAAGGGAWRVKRSGMGDFGGGSLEHPRLWLGSQWLGLNLGVPSYP